MNLPNYLGIKRHNHGKNHSYTIDGVKADGVTTLLSEGMPKKALAPWAARRVAEYVADADEEFLSSLKRGGRNSFVHFLKNVPWDERDKAGVRGTMIHNLAEQLINGEPVDVPEHLVGHVEATVKFMDDWRPRAVLTECVVASRTWGYAGTFDLVADLPDGRRILFDYKTAASGIWPETAMQLAAYRYADMYLGDDGTEMPVTEIGIEDSYAVWIRADGYDCIPLNTSQEVFSAFLHVAQVARNNRTAPSWIKAAEQAPHWDIAA